MNFTNDDVGSLGREFRKLREAKKLTRADVAAKCWFSNERWIKLFETSDCEVSVQKVCDVFSAIGESVVLGKSKG